MLEHSEDPLCSLVIPNMASARERNHHHSKDILLTPTPLKVKEKSAKKTFLDKGFKTIGAAAAKSSLPDELSAVKLINEPKRRLNI